MKNILFILSIIIIFHGSVISQWTWVDPVPQGNNLYNIELFNSGKVISTGKFGTIISTTNDGVNWNVTNNVNNVNSDILSLFKLNDNILYFGTLNGNLLKSTDAGLNWNFLFNTGSAIKRIFFMSEQNGYIITGSAVSKTTNGGANWSIVYNGGAVNIDDIYFTDAITGIICGGAASEARTLARTTNGGTSWTPVTVPGNGSELIKIFFINSMTGFITSFGEIIKTTDGGLNWLNIPITTGQLNDIHFFDVNTGYILGSSTTYDLYKSTNGGLNWSGIDINFTSFNTYGPNSMSFKDASTGYVLTAQHIVVKTTNGGLNWNNLNTSSICNYAPTQAIQFINSSTGFIGHWADGQYGVIKKTTNAGNNWVNVASSGPTIGHIYALHFPTQQTGYAVGGGSKGCIYKSSNGGNNWTIIDTSLGTGFHNGVYFIDNNTGFVLGYNMEIFRTSNGGTSWSTFNSGVSFRLNSITFINSLTGYTCGGSGTAKLFKTTDAGLNWNVIYSASGTSFNCISFLSSTTGFISGYGILKTTDAGASWVQKSSIQLYFGKMYFVNATTGFATANFGRIFKSTDAGETWNELYSPTNNYLTGISFINESTGFITGDQGFILKTTNAGGNYIIGITPNNNNANTFSLTQNYPNPFNPTTRIQFTVPKKSFVSLVIYDIIGRDVETLVNEELMAGTYDAEWDGSKYSSGVYFYRIMIGSPSSGPGQSFTETKKMILLK